MKGGYFLSYQEWIIHVCYRVQADRKGKVTLPMSIGSFEPCAWAGELNLIPQLQLSGGCTGLTAEVSIYIGILSNTIRNYLQLVGKYFVGWFCEYV